MVTFLLILRRSGCYICADGETNSISTSSDSAPFASSSGATFDIEVVGVYSTNAGTLGSITVDLLGFKFSGGMLLVDNAAKGIDCIFLIIGSSSICGGDLFSSDSLSLYFKLKRMSSFISNTLLNDFQLNNYKQTTTLKQK